MDQATTRNPAAGFGLALASALFFALLDVAIRYCAPYLNIWQIIFGRSLLATLLLVVLARLLAIDLLGRQRRVLLLVGAAGGLGVICLTAAILLLPLFQALVLLYLYPLVAALLSPALTGDRFRPKDWLALVAGLAGTVLVLWPAEGLHGPLGAGHLLGLAAACCYGLAMTLTRRVMVFSSPLTPMFYITVMAGLACALPAVLSPPPGGALSLPGLLILVALTLFGILAYLTSNMALGNLPAPTVGVIAMLEVVFSAALGFLLFHEGIGLPAFFGGGMILGSGLLLTLGPGRKGLRPHQP